ncbi:MAG: hypothetical protein ABEJ05_01155 [Haloglomus sp.]
MPHIRSLERRRGALFLLAGGSLVVYATFNGIAASTGISYPAVENIFGPGGFVLGFLGLLGLYPSLADRSPKLARIGAVGAGLGAVGFTVITAASFGRALGVVPTQEPAWFPVLLLLVALGMIPGYLTVAAATLRTDVHPGRLGLLLLAPAVIFATMMTQATLFRQFGLLSETYLMWSATAISAGQAVSHLAIGHVLRTERTGSDQEVPAGDAVTG